MLLCSLVFLHSTLSFYNFTFFSIYLRLFDIRIHTRLSCTHALLYFTLRFFLLALQSPLGVVSYSPLVGFSLLACEVS